MMSNITMQTKKAFFFSHDSNARNDEKIINLRMQHGAEGYGVYFMLIEMLLESTDYRLGAQYPALAFNLRVDREVIRSVVEDFGLFHFAEDSASFYSQSLNERMKPLEQIREKRRKAGIRSGEVRRAKAAAKSTKKKSKCDSIKRVDKEDDMAISIVNNVDKIIVDADIFIPPTETELKEYCVDNKMDIDVGSFVDFYQSKGWMIGQNEMRDWRAALRGWHRNEFLKPKKRQQLKETQSILNIARFYNDKTYEKF